MVFVSAALVALSVAFTWPLGDLAHPVLPSHDDPLFSVWRIAWVAHQLPRDVTQLFDTNIFYPLKDTLAYSDAMLLLGMAGAPLIWAGVSPVIVHNLLVVAAFATAAMAMMRLMAYHTDNVLAQAVAGVIFAYAPYRVAHLVHLELLWTAFLPLAVLALYRVLERPSFGRAAWLGATVGLQGLCSIYYGAFLAIWLVSVVATAPLHVAFRWSKQHLVAGVVSVATAGVLLSPYAGPYARAHATVGPRTDYDVQQFSAELSDYLRSSPHNRVYPGTPSAVQDDRTLFLGFIAMTLAVVGALLVRSRTTIAYAVVTLVALDLSLGVNGITYSWLRSAMPVVDGFRAPARFGVLTLLGTAVLAGLGAARLMAARRVGAQRVGAWILLAAIIGEYWAAPISSYEAPLKPAPAHEWLAAQPPTVVAAMPMPAPSELWGLETLFQYLSTFHWQPMVNGYSGHLPASYIEVLRRVQYFPSVEALEALRSHGVQVVLLQERYSDGQFDRYLYACHDRKWFSDVLVFKETGIGRSAVCRVVPEAPHRPIPEDPNGASVK